VEKKECSYTGGKTEKKKKKVAILVEKSSPK
jgi:hypothetical protein